MMESFRVERLMLAWRMMRFAEPPVPYVEQSLTHRESTWFPYELTHSTDLPSGVF